MINTTLNIAHENEEFLTECKSRDINFGPFGGLKPGAQYRFAFPNGYGASVIKLYGSYGYDDDLWEVALTAADTGDLLYSHDFATDVVPACTDEDVNDLLKKIQQYPELKEKDNEL